MELARSAPERPPKEKLLRDKGPREEALAARGGEREARDGRELAPGRSGDHVLGREEGRWRRPRARAVPRGRARERCSGSRASSTWRSSARRALQLRVAVSHPTKVASDALLRLVPRFENSAKDDDQRCLKATRRCQHVPHQRRLRRDELQTVRSWIGADVGRAAASREVVRGTPTGARERRRDRRGRVDEEPTTRAPLDECTSCFEVVRDDTAHDVQAAPAGATTTRRARATSGSAARAARAVRVCADALAQRPSERPVHAPRAGRAASIQPGRRRGRRRVGAMRRTPRSGAAERRHSCTRIVLRQTAVRRARAQDPERQTSTSRSEVRDYTRQAQDSTWRRALVLESQVLPCQPRPCGRARRWQRRAGREISRGSSQVVDPGVGRRGGARRYRRECGGVVIGQTNDVVAHPRARRLKRADRHDGVYTQAVGRPGDEPRARRSFLCWMVLQN